MRTGTSDTYSVYPETLKSLFVVIVLNVSGIDKRTKT